MIKTDATEATEANLITILVAEDSFIAFPPERAR